METRPSLIDGVDLSGIPNDWSIHAPDQGYPVTIAPPDEPGDPSGSLNTYISLHYSPGASRVPGQPDGGHLKIGHFYVNGSVEDKVEVFKFDELEKFVQYKVENY